MELVTLRCVVKIMEPNGRFILSSEASHQIAFARHDPFLWILPGEPDGSLLFIKPEEDDLDPPTLRCPISNV